MKRVSFFSMPLRFDLLRMILLPTTLSSSALRSIC